MYIPVLRVYVGFYHQLGRNGWTYFQTIIFSAGTYLAFPMGTFTCAPVVFSGVGIRKTTLLALSLPSKLALRCIVYSTRDLDGSVTCVWSLNGKLILDVDRYLASALSAKRNSPHELKLSIWRDEADGSVRVEFAKADTLVELTIVQLDCAFRSWRRVVAPIRQLRRIRGRQRTHFFCRMSLSLRPNLHSGVPLRYALIIT